MMREEEEKKGTQKGFEDQQLLLKTIKASNLYIIFIYSHTPVTICNLYISFYLSLHSLV